MAENFAYSRYYDNFTDGDRFVVIYNLHLSIVQTFLMAIVGVIKWHWVSFVFNASPVKIATWVLIALTLNASWLVSWAFGLRISQAVPEQRFCFKLVVVSQFMYEKRGY